MKPTQVLSIICNTICLHFSLCRVWVCFYWFHHVFLILSVILTKYHYIILTYNMLSGYLLQLSVSSKLRRRNRLIIRCANGDFTNKHSNYCQCELLPSLGVRRLLSVICSHFHILPICCFSGWFTVILFFSIHVSSSSSLEWSDISKKKLFTDFCIKVNIIGAVHLLMPRLIACFSYPGIRALVQKCVSLSTFMISFASIYYSIFFIVLSRIWNS